MTKSVETNGDMGSIGLNHGVSHIHHDGHIFQKPMESMDIIYDIFSYHCWLVVFRHPSEKKVS